MFPVFDLVQPPQQSMLRMKQVNNCVLPEVLLRVPPFGDIYARIVCTADFGIFVCIKIPLWILSVSFCIVCAELIFGVLTLKFQASLL